MLAAPSAGNGFHSENTSGSPTPEVFSLSGIGVDADRFICDLAPELDRLTWDEYDVKAAYLSQLLEAFPLEKDYIFQLYPDYYSGEIRMDEFIDAVAKGRAFNFKQIRPHRKRAMSQLDVDLFDSELDFTPVSGQDYIQPDVRAHIRSLPRTYPEASEVIMQHPGLHAVIRYFAGRIRDEHPMLKRLRVKVHPTSVISTQTEAGQPSLEGIHRDGADKIISALCVSKRWVSGAQSVVYGSDGRTEILRHTLEPGEGIFQDDRELYHDVTPLLKIPKAPSLIGVRNMIGFDFHYLD